MSAKKKAPGMSADETAVRAYLIEHGGAPSMTFVLDSAPGATLTSPQYPDPLPTLAQAMRDYPCKDEHGDRSPAVCCIARRLKKGAKFTDNGLDGPDCGREIPLKLLGREAPHIGCPICRPYPKGYDPEKERRKADQVRMLEMTAQRGPRRQRREATRTLKKVAKKRQN